MKVRKIVKEGFDESGTPDMKYYSFDWDDNIAVMPTKIVLLDDEGNEVGMSTEDFAEYRTEIGKEPFEYNGHTVTGFAEDAFRYFRTLGDKQFIVDSMTAKPGPAWDDFVEAINNGSIFSIVTARGHHPNTLKEACYNYIVSNHNGIDSNELVKNLEKYRDLADEEQLSKKDMIREYLDMCRFYLNSRSHLFPRVGRSSSRPEPRPPYLAALLPLAWLVQLLQGESPVQHCSPQIEEMNRTRQKVLGSTIYA